MLFYWSWFVGHSRLRGIRGWKVPHSEFSPFGVESLSGLSLFCFNNRVKSILCWVPFWVQSIWGWVPFDVESILCWVPFWVQSILSSVQSEFSPLGVESFRGWVHSGLSPFGVESLRGWVHSGLSTFGVETNRGWVHSDKSPIIGSADLDSVGESFKKLYFRFSRK